jgi:hypothetical protein
MLKGSPIHLPLLLFSCMPTCPYHMCGSFFPSSQIRLLIKFFFFVYQRARLRSSLALHRTLLASALSLAGFTAVLARCVARPLRCSKGLAFRDVLSSGLPSISGFLPLLRVCSRPGVRMPEASIPVRGPCTSLAVLLLPSAPLLLLLTAVLL